LVILAESFGEVELATPQWVGWRDGRRLASVLSASSADRSARRTERTRTLEPIGDVPPAAFEDVMKPNTLVSKIQVIQCVVTQ
jgi:hypothetical protein